MKSKEPKKFITEKIALCDCKKGTVPLDHKGGLANPRPTDQKDDICLYCGNYVYWKMCTYEEGKTWEPKLYLR